MTAPHIVFVHIGSRLPDHLLTAVAQARRFNAGGIWLVAPALALQEAVAITGHGLNTVACEELGLSDVHRRFLAVATLDRSFRDGFWLHTTERFFYLETLMAWAGLTHVCHLENDVMLYADLAVLAPVFDRCYPAMAATFDAPGRCVPGFVYARDRASLGRLTAFIVDVFAATDRTPNDMALLAGFRATFGAGAMDTLPIVPEGCPHLIAERLGSGPGGAAAFWNHFAAFGGVFDAAAIGQYLGGVDPRNSGGKDTSGFVNETSVFDPSRCRYGWETDDRSRRYPVAEDAVRRWRVNTLHIHSKALERFTS
ncbi:MAG: hypothetical protein ABIL58_29070 [Pseudomonadota bacterium]